MTTATINRPPVLNQEKEMPEKHIFVFGSNVRGIHGGGAAAYALKEYRAVWGKGIGHWGYSYAIPTKGNIVYAPKGPHEDPRLGVGATLKLEQIQEYVEDFLTYANRNPDMIFKVTCIGCGLAGLQHEDIAPMFKGAPENCWFDTLWKGLIPEGPYNYWGSF